MRKLTHRLAVIALALSLTVFAAVGVVQAATTEYFGEDLGLGETTRLSSWPNAEAAEAEFLSRLTGVGTEDFEGFAQGNSTPLAIDFGVAGTATLYGNGYINSLPAATDPSFGRYPTSGDKYWEASSSFWIEFSQPIAAIGFYATDIGDFNGQVVVELENGGTRSYTIDNTVGGAGGSVLFYGIIEDDPALQFTKVTFGNTAPGVDYFGFDDFTIGTLTQVVTPVGGTAQPIDRLALLAPWIALGAAMIAGAAVHMRRRLPQS